MTTTAMGPPPPRALNPKEATKEASTSEATQMAPPELTTEPSSLQVAEKSSCRRSPEVPYAIPPWSGAPCHEFAFEVLKDGSIVDRFDVNQKGAYMFGRVDLCDFVLDHPTISRFHAVVQFKRSGEAYIYDLGTTHGTSVNKKQVEMKIYVDLHVGDVVRFGKSTRLYIFQGPTDLMPPEINLKIKREAKIRAALFDREASLHRARQEASLADGISWGMGEDAIEEAEDDVDEITWQTYKGQLTERQEKTREKVIKRLEKIGHMKKEIDAIRAKDISQGGLTQGQQTQIARNEQRMAQILEELENLEETLNDSIRESLGARGKLSTGKKKAGIEEEDECLSDDDDFYDRTKKKPSAKKGAQNQSVETVDSLLDKRDTITKEIDEKKESLVTEENRIASEKVDVPETGDALDAFMSDISSQLVIDKTKQIKDELSALQTEFDRISYLLKIADPSGEAAKKRALKLQEPEPVKSKTPAVSIKKLAPKVSNQSSKPENPANGPSDATKEGDGTNSEGTETEKSKAPLYVPTKPQWLGAVAKRETEENQLPVAAPTVEGSDDFVDYKDRNKILGDGDGIENAAPGLIIRKRKKQVDTKNVAQDEVEPSSTSSAEVMAMDAVALLLKHQRAQSIVDEDGGSGDQEPRSDPKVKKDKKKLKRVIGPAKPSFLDDASEYETTWVPPEGQSGDGRTSLNDRYGY